LGDQFVSTGSRVTKRVLLTRNEFKFKKGVLCKRNGMNNVYLSSHFVSSLKKSKCLAHRIIENDGSTREKIQVPKSMSL
jgi:hypothetical protein